MPRSISERHHRRSLTAENRSGFIDNLKGHEVMSYHYAGVVAIQPDGKVIRAYDHKNLGNINKWSDKRVHDLHDELFYDEFGYYPTDKKFGEELNREFGPQLRKEAKK
jgi:hypothetical protein